MNTEGNSRKDRLFTDLSDFLGIPLPRVLLLDDLVHVIFQVYDDFVSNSAFRGIDEPYSTLLYSTLLDFTLPLPIFTDFSDFLGRLHAADPMTLDTLGVE